MMASCHRRAASAEPAEPADLWRSLVLDEYTVNQEKILGPSGTCRAERRLFYAARSRVKQSPENTLERMFRNTVICEGLKDGETAEAVADMLAEFAQRPWHQAVTCEWQAGILRLSTQSEGDPTGMALLDEFQDAVVACINFSDKIHFEVESCVPL